MFGGETTVTKLGDGLGGRCQELALAAALQLGISFSVSLIIVFDSVHVALDA